MIWHENNFESDTAVNRQQVQLLQAAHTIEAGVEKNKFGMLVLVTL